MATCCIYIDVDSDVDIFFLGAVRVFKMADDRIEEQFVCGCYYV